MVDHLAGEEPADDVDALEEPGVTDVLAGPGVTGDPLVAGLARAECRPEAAGEHARQGRDRLRVMAGW